MALTVRDLYQQIGTFFREKGADRIILLSSRPILEPEPENGKQMILQVAVDNGICQADVKEELERLWPQLEIQVLEYGVQSEDDLIHEIEWDGIKL